MPAHTRRRAILALAGASSLPLVLPGCGVLSPKLPEPTRAVAYVSNADSREISVLSLDLATGAVQALQTVPVAGTVMPLALSPDRRFLYAALRSEPYAVVSFAIDRATGRLQSIGQSPLPDSMPALATDRSGRWLFAASYGGNKVSVSPIGADGLAGAATQVLPTGKNAHAVVIDAGNRFLFVPTLGSDQVMQWRFDAATGLLAPNAPAVVDTTKGAGPRHLVLHPNGRHAYLLNELDAAVELLDLDAARGTLAPRQRWSTLPPGFTGKPWAADLHLSPDGRFLYTSERTSSTLAMWSVDAASGTLDLIGHEPTEKQPRGFQVDPTGRWLLAVGQVSNGLSVYRIDAASGRLTRQSSSMRLGRNPNWVEIVGLA
ncbi:lactonase family protein [Aquabacterium humicola]|uniref:lactonase family protein n=1 Tax=Aquabacterium humicola TaxID=3237377 RepID=UPI0025439B05|nr:lactonase family protein [Rubrivivax pictus]